MITINNKKKANKVKMNYSLGTLFFLLIIVISFFVELLEGYTFIAAFTVVSLSIFIYSLLLKPTYIYFTDRDKSIVLRYVSINPITSDNNAIEITQKEFVKYEVTDIKFPKYTLLKIFVKTNEGIASYPEISLSTLTKEEHKELLLALNKYVK